MESLRLKSRRTRYWHHFYAFDELLTVLAYGVEAKQIEIVDGAVSIWVSYAKTGPAFHRVASQHSRESIASKCIEPIPHIDPAYSHGIRQDLPDGFRRGADRRRGAVMFHGVRPWRCYFACLKLCFT